MFAHKFSKKKNIICVASKRDKFRYSSITIHGTCLIKAKRLRAWAKVEFEFKPSLIPNLKT
jgi:hypothetical protein